MSSEQLAVSAKTRQRLETVANSASNPGGNRNMMLTPRDAEAIVASLADQREVGLPCEACGKPVAVGQVVTMWEDVGEIHADCDRPYSLTPTMPDDWPAPIVLLGNPMRHVLLSALTAPTRDGEAGREVQSVWRCAIGDATGALDILKHEWQGSRRKAERQAGDVLSGVLNLVWAARDPAPKNYSEASDSGNRLQALVRAALATQAEGVDA